MEIQRQSDYYSLDRPEIHHAQLTAEQIADFTKGVGIPQGMLNTRLAWREGEPWTYAPEDRLPDESGEYDYDDYDIAEEEALNAFDHHIPEDLVLGREAAQRPGLDLGHPYGVGAHDPHTPAPWLLPDYEDEDDEDLEEVPLEVPLPVGHGLDLDGVLAQAVSRQI